LLRARKLLFARLLKRIWIPSFRRKARRWKKGKEAVVADVSAQQDKRKK
jgi:hypothetical protein